MDTGTGCAQQRQMIVSNERVKTAFCLNILGGLFKEGFHCARTEADVIIKGHWTDATTPEHRSCAKVEVAVLGSRP